MLQVGGSPKISAPPVAAEYETVMHPSQPGAAPKPVPCKLFRSGDGKMCADYGDKSVISDPAAEQAIMLDHVKKEALVFPMRPEPQPAPLPRGEMPPAPTAPSVKAQELGKKIVEGHEAEGKQYIVEPPKPFTPPVVKAPGPPPLPQMAKLPQAPKPPATAPPSMPHTVEVWTSTKLHLPILTKVTGRFGQQTSRCKSAAAGEPPAAKFQIPPGYKVVK